jgi:hypothetical protein
MDRKDIYMDSSFEVGISFGNSPIMDTTKRYGGLDGTNIRNGNRLYNSKMGEVAVKILNVFGLMGLVYGFVSNLSNIVSVFIGIGSLMWIVYRGLKERENWLHRKAERKRLELENMELEDRYIRKKKFK